MKTILITITIILFFAISISAQTTEFTYQGKLNDGSLAANGTYDFQFELYDAALGGNLLGTQSAAAVMVNNGIFTVRLNFGAQFNGTDRFLSISVRNVGVPAYTLLNPRQPITSAPYSIRSLQSGTALTAIQADLAANADRLGGITADQFIAAMTDARTPLPGSPSYVQNTTTQQLSSNFNVSGTGTANIFNAATQYNIGGNRAFTAVGGGNQNVFAGINAGTNTTGFGNTFVGNSSGTTNTTGINNSFFGADAGRTTNGNGNSFFGRSSGFDTTSGLNNSFFGLDSGRFNITGSNNAFFGKDSGFNNTADSNSFFGYRSGFANTSGDSNSFFGNGAGQANQTGRFNSFFGNNAGNQNTGTSNSFFGNNAGSSTVGGGNNAFFGTATGQQNTTGSNNTFYGTAAGFDNAGGSNNTAIGFLANVGSALNYGTAIGSGSIVSNSNTIALGRSNGSDSVLIYGDLAVNGTFNVPSGDTDYIQNRTTQQTTTNFNIGGTGTATILNAATQFNLNGNRILSAPGANNLFVGHGSGTANSGTGNTFVGTNAGNSATTGVNNTFIGANSGFSSSGSGSGNIVIGAFSTVAPTATNSIIIGNNIGTNVSNTLTLSSSLIDISGVATFNDQVEIENFLYVAQLSSGGSTDLCMSFGFLATCSSSLRYKSNVETYRGGLEVLRRFRPVTFDWRSDGKHDVGFVAEEVAEIEPLLVTHNKDGQIEGVKYAQVTTVLINAVKEQQTEIEQLRSETTFQRQQIELLKKLVCQQSPQAEVCR